MPAISLSLVIWASIMISGYSVFSHEGADVHKEEDFTHACGTCFRIKWNSKVFFCGGQHEVCHDPKPSPA
jgi:hypothetical protein